MMGVVEWCPWSDSNRHASRHRILNPARLPVPPQGHRAFVTAKRPYSCEERFRNKSFGGRPSHRSFFGLRFVFLGLGFRTLMAAASNMFLICDA